MSHELVLAVSGLGVLGDIGRSLREAFFMFWATLWALVLGFGLSGAVQAFVSRGTMHRVLGDHRPGAIARAAGLGAASSSCSYAASAMAKTLFARGADFLAAMAFMFASTNLVIELGIVLVVLIGWQFAAGEFIGGAIMIVLLVVFGRLALRPQLIESARRRLQGPEDDPQHDHATESDEGARRPWRERLGSLGSWSDAASYALADLGMLRNEMLIGYVVAGFLAVLVPESAWHSVFLRGHGALTSAENVIVGPFIALISFVCSVGNVPLAAALWKGGISFGGVTSFIFADLIALPLLLIYRKFYGGRLALRMLALFWVTMSAAGLATLLRRRTDPAPPPRPGRRDRLPAQLHDRAEHRLPTPVRRPHLAGAQPGALRGRRRIRHRPRLRNAGADGARTRQPRVPRTARLLLRRPLRRAIRHRPRTLHPGRRQPRAHAPPDGRAGAHRPGVRDDRPAHHRPSTEHAGQRVYFCCAGCRERFEQDPERYVAQPRS